MFGFFDEVLEHAPSLSFEEELEFLLNPFVVLKLSPPVLLDVSH